MNELKLLALDEDDLDIVSTHMQDAVFKVGDVTFDGKRANFTLIGNRFVWEKAAAKGRSFERRRSALSFKRVKSVKSKGINLKNKDVVLDLLALRFEKTDDGPEGVVELLLAGDATIHLEVECIEAQLADLGGAWETVSKPRHLAEF